jgi:hypothetical protein
MVLFDASLDVFNGIGGATYVSFQAHLLAENKACPDESKAPWREAFRSELYDPKDETNKAALPYAIRIVEVWCSAISTACGTTAVKDYLKGGAFGKDKQTPEMRTQLKGQYRNDDRLGESVFGLLKEIAHGTRCIPPQVAAGMASAVKQNLFGDPNAAKGAKLGARKPKRPAAAAAAAAEAPARPSPFSIFRLPPDVLEALVSMIRFFARTFFPSSFS